jgi:hypothetical protein
MLPRRLKAQFTAAIRGLLRPIVRQLIAYGVTYPIVNQIVKQLYVETADREFRLPYKRQTDSRLALVTGLSRKEVAQLRREPPDRQKLPELEDTLVTHVIGRWMAGPPYASRDGAPRQLLYESEDPKTPTFHGLVREQNVDIPVRAVLDELIRTGIVELLPDGSLLLRREGHIPGTGTEAKFTLIAADPGELFTSIVHNIEQPDKPWLQRKVVYDNIGSDALPRLQEEARKLGEEFLRRANALIASYDRDRNPKAPGGSRSRVVLGAYYFEEQTEPKDAAPKDHRAAPPGRIRRT